MNFVRTALVVVGVSAGVLGNNVKDAHAIDIFCPSSLTATWIQAANGATNVVNKLSVRISSPLPQPTTRLTCVLDGVADGERISQRVNVGPNAPQLCGAKATFRGQGWTRNGVPPFGGFTFQSDRLPATATYNNATGDCLLEISLKPLLTTERVTQECRALNLNSWRCPNGVQTASNQFGAEPLDSAVAELLPGFSHYDIFDAPRGAPRSAAVLSTPAAPRSWLERLLGT